MARQFGLKRLSVTRTAGAPSATRSLLRVVTEAKPAGQLPKALYAPASWRGSSERRTTSSAD
jgi:hypothetical protein